MVKVTYKQRIWECHSTELTDDEYKQFRKIKGKNAKVEFLDNHGVDGAEHEPDGFFVIEVL